MSNDKLQPATRTTVSYATAVASGAKSPPKDAVPPRAASPPRATSSPRTSSPLKAASPLRAASPLKTPLLTAPVEMHLPKFWKRSPREWFVNAERYFIEHGVQNYDTRLNLVLRALDDDSARSVSDLVDSPQLQLERVKNRLVTMYRGLPWEPNIPNGIVGRTGEFLDLQRITPSAALYYVRSYLVGEDESTIKYYWLQNIPEVCYRAVWGLDGYLERIAACADDVWLANACRNNEIAVNVDEDRMAALERTVKALVKSVESLKMSNDSVLASVESMKELVKSMAAERETSKEMTRADQVGSGSPKLQQPKDDTVVTNGWCYYHNLHGSYARKCRSPCTYSTSK